MNDKNLKIDDLKIKVVIYFHNHYGKKYRLIFWKFLIWGNNNDLYDNIVKRRKDNDGN